VKYDGYRLRLERDGDRTRLITGWDDCPKSRDKLPLRCSAGDAREESRAGALGPACPEGTPARRDPIFADDAMDVGLLTRDHDEGGELKIDAQLLEVRGLQHVVGMDRFRIAATDIGAPCDEADREVARVIVDGPIDCMPRLVAS
jgi:hypothetical protein